MISQAFKDAIRQSPLKSYEIAHKAGLHQSTLSKIVCGIDLVREGDERVLRVAKVLGLEAEDCFEGEECDYEGSLDADQV
jgi:transcriptional regulator with XRE-family HTH domain